MPKPPNGKPQLTTKGKGSPKDTPTPTGDAALGAGGAGFLVVVANYLSGGRIPSEIIAGATPFLSLLITYLIEVRKQKKREYQQKKKEQQEEQDIRKYEKLSNEYLNDQNLSEDARRKILKDLEAFKLQRFSASTQRISIEYGYDEVIQTVSSTR